jgi:hypothetical protein
MNQTKEPDAGMKLLPQQRQQIINNFLPLLVAQSLPLSGIEGMLLVCWRTNNTLAQNKNLKTNLIF